MESLPYPLSTLHVLLHASRDTAGFALDEGFGGEVVDAGVEAVGDEVGEHLWKWDLSVLGFWSREGCFWEGRGDDSLMMREDGG